MDRDTAQQAVQNMLGSDILSLLSPAETDAALDGTQDAGDWDPWLAAAEIATWLGNRASRGEVVEWESDGQRVKRSAADWWGLAARLREQSPRTEPGDADGFAFLVV